MNIHAENWVWSRVHVLLMSELLASIMLDTNPCY